MKNKVGKIISGLKKDYKNNLIKYPRIDNDYNKNGFTMYPHPTFSKKYSQPLSENDYEFKKETVYLELSNNLMLSPSLLFKNHKNSVEDIIETFFDERMQLIKEEKNRITEIINNFDLFLNGFEIDENYLSEIQKIEMRSNKCQISINNSLEEVIEISTGLNNHKDFKKNIENNIVKNFKIIGY